MQSSQINSLTLLNCLGSIFFQPSLLKRLKTACRICARPIGLSNSTKNMEAFIEPPYYLDKYATVFVYLNQTMQKAEKINFAPHSQHLKQRLLEVSQTDEYLIYKHYQTTLYLLDGHKFGGLFLGYTADPDQHHAKYLIFTDKQARQKTHRSRLSQLCKKQGVVAVVDEVGQVREECVGERNQARTRLKSQDRKQAEDRGINQVTSKRVKHA